MVPQHGPFSLHTVLEGPWLHKTAFPTSMVQPLNDSPGSSPLQGHSSWLTCELALRCNSNDLLKRGSLFLKRLRLHASTSVQECTKQEAHDINVLTRNDYYKLSRPNKCQLMTYQWSHYWFCRNVFLPSVIGSVSSHWIELASCIHTARVVWNIRRYILSSWRWCLFSGSILLLYNDVFSVSTAENHRKMGRVIISGAAS